MNRYLFFPALLLSALLAARPASGQQVVQPPRPPYPPRPPQPAIQPPRPPVRPPQPAIQPPRPPYPPRPPRPVVQPPRPPYGGWLAVATLAVRQPVGQAGAVLTGGYHRFRYLKLRVNNVPLTLDHLLVSYDYGPASSVPLRYHLLPGHDSAPLSLQRLGGRRIRRLDLWYTSGGGLFNPAIVTILGLR